eukprot:TRINITY_DN5772_c0_g1_i1.p1 TRINITY_DN5772_c0_g1~~TRINITY_DN5772_c0_g1_i1.p1  ORF type:complete len:295 (+),score=30.83 TRINITY_DN5772_c0_g1_i1:59-886(+)
MLSFAKAILTLLATAVSADRVEMLMTNWEVRAFNPTFACTSFDLADMTDLSTEKWGVSFNTIDRSGKDSKYVVHHIVLYGCDSKNEMWERYTSGGECIFLELLPSACGSVVWTSQDPMPDNYTVPGQSGIPFSMSSNRFLIMEIHYENVNFSPGGIDSSGMEIILTNDRPFFSFVFQDFIDAPGSQILGDSIYLPSTDAPTTPSPAGNTSTAAPSGPAVTDSDDSGDSTILIVLLVVGVLVVLLLVLIAFVLIKKKRDPVPQNTDNQHAFVEMKE